MPSKSGAGERKLGNLRFHHRDGESGIEPRSQVVAGEKNGLHGAGQHGVLAQRGRIPDDDPAERRGTSFLGLRSGEDEGLVAQHGVPCRHLAPFDHLVDQVVLRLRGEEDTLLGPLPQRGPSP